MKKKKKPQLLWQIKSPTAPGASFLFGTMHVRDLRAFDYQELVCEKIDTCVAFATEINLNEASLVLGDQSMDLPDGKSLDQLFPPKKFKKIARFFYQTTGFPIDPFVNSHPMMLVNILTSSILSQDRPVSLDEFLWKYAERQDKLLLGIERVAEQLEIMASIPLEFHLRSLWLMAKNVSRFRKSLLKMATMYQSGDLSRILKSAKKSSGGMRKLLLYDRNLLMAERITGLVTEQPTFCAIGAGHLGGKRGVLKLLKDEGFKLSNVRVGPRIS